MRKRKKSKGTSTQGVQYQDALCQYQMEQQQNESARGWTIKEVASVMATFDMLGRVVAYGCAGLGVIALLQLIVGLDQYVLYAAQKFMIALVGIMIFYKCVYDQFVDDEE